jgi:hypothetical protein
MSDNTACENTDKELWRERDGDYYADSIHVTERGGIGIDCCGMVFVRPLREWHKLAVQEALRECSGYEPGPESPVCKNCGMTRNLHALASLGDARAEPEQVRLLHETNKAAQCKRIEAEQRVKALEKQIECARNDLYSAIRQMAASDDQLICFQVRVAYSTLGGEL